MGRPLNFLLLVVVIVCGASLWLAQGRPLPGFLSSETGPHEQIDSKPLETRLEPVHLRILNGTEEAGLAGEIALLVTRLGCVVEGVGNATPWPSGATVLINRRLAASEAAALAARLGGIPVLKEWDERTTEDAVLVLGNDHQITLGALKAVGR